MLISTYVCHPSLANDNLSGIAVATMLAQALCRSGALRHTYRFLFAPGTIGPLAWLHENRDWLDRIEHGLTLSCIGDDGDLTYKRSRRGDAEVDRAMEIVLRDSGAPHRVLPWEPWGGDERQFCSPGFDLPVGTLMRTPHGEFNGYHTSADGLSGSGPSRSPERSTRCLELVEVLETNRRCTQPEPVRRAAARAPRALSLGRRSRGDARRRARPALGAQPERRRADAARHRRARAASRYPAIQRAAERLELADLLATAP